MLSTSTPITATATDPLFNTSELSSFVYVDGVAPPPYRKQR